MASNLEVQVFDYNEQIEQPVIIEKPAPQRIKRQNVIPSVKKPLTRLNIFLIAAVFTMLTVESVIYFHSVQIGISANQMQSDINKTREENDFLKVELANSKELANIENIATRALQMKPADSDKISYLQMPVQVTDKDYLITNISPKEKKVFVPVGY